MNALILILLFIKSKSVQCPQYDGVTTIVDGTDDDYPLKNLKVYSCNSVFKQNLEATQCRLLIFGCSFSISRIDSSGGAMYLKFYDVADVGAENIIESCTFTKCKAAAGSAVYIDGNKYATPFRFENCVFSDNECTSTYSGGTIYAESVNLTLIKCQFTNNIAKEGIAVDFPYSTVPNDKKDRIHFLMDQCTFECSITNSNTDSLFNLNVKQNAELRLILKDCTINIKNAPSSFLFIKHYGINPNTRFYSFSNNYIFPYKKEIIMEKLTQNFEEGFKDLIALTKPDKEVEVKPDPKDPLKTRFDIEDFTEEKVLAKISDSTFDKFKSDDDGGAVYSKDVRLSLEGTKFSDCETKGGGGAVYAKNTKDDHFQAIIQNTDFKNCKATYGSAVFIYNTKPESDVSIQYCTFEKNVAQSDTSGGNLKGAALFIISKVGKVNGCTFLENTGGAVKVSEDFSLLQETFSQKLYAASQKLNTIEISKCNFKVNKDSQNSIYYVGGLSGVQVNVFECNFSGKLAKGQNHVDGQLYDKNMPKVNIKNCKLSHKAVNKNVADYSSARFLNGNLVNILFIGVCAVASVAFIAFLTIKFKKAQNEIQDDESEEKEILNESL